METWQMIKELTENPGKKFISDKGQNGNEMTAERLQQNIIFKYTNKYVEVDRIAITREWEEVKQPVDFITAFNALQHDRKNIYCILNGKKHLYEGNCTGTFTFREDRIAEGEWYVE